MRFFTVFIVISSFLQCNVKNRFLQYKTQPGSCALKRYAVFNKKTKVIHKQANPCYSACCGDDFTILNNTRVICLILDSTRPIKNANILPIKSHNYMFDITWKSVTTNKTENGKWTKNKWVTDNTNWSQSFRTNKNHLLNPMQSQCYNTVTSTPLMLFTQILVNGKVDIHGWQATSLRNYTISYTGKSVLLSLWKASIRLSKPKR